MCLADYIVKGAQLTQLFYREQRMNEQSETNHKDTESGKGSKKAANAQIKMPHTLVIIFSLICFAMILSFIIPGGKYGTMEKEIKSADGVTIRTVIDPEAYQPAESAPQGPWKMVNAIMKAMQHDHAVGIIFFILLIGGAFGIINETNTIEEALSSLVKYMGSSGTGVIPVIMIVFSLGGATFGMCEETIPFVAMAVPLALKLGYDSITGVAMVYLGAMVGFATAFLNPFTVGVAQGIAEVPPFSGMTYRLGLWVLFTAFSIWWVLRYANKIKNNPELSPVYDLDQEKRQHSAEAALSSKGLHGGQIAVLIIIAAGFSAIVYGAIKLGWYIDEMASMFLAIGILSGIAAGLTPNAIAKSFVKGCSDICGAAIMVGFARTVLVILEDAMVMDTILHYVSGLIGDFSPAVSVQAMYAFQTLTNFFVPSGSGQASLTMPIMTPLADLLGVTRQTAVLAYQFGDGFTNLIIPTSAVTIAALGMGGVPWERWARWVLPLIVIFFILGGLCLIPPVLVGWTG